MGPPMASLQRVNWFQKEITSITNCFFTVIITIPSVITILLIAKITVILKVIFCPQNQVLGNPPQ